MKLPVLFLACLAHVTFAVAPPNQEEAWAEDYYGGQSRNEAQLLAKKYNRHSVVAFQVKNEAEKVTNFFSGSVSRGVLGLRSRGGLP